MTTMSDTPMSTDPRDRLEPGWRTDYKYRTCGPPFVPKRCGGELWYPPGAKIAQCPVCKAWVGRFEPYLGGTITGLCMTGGCACCNHPRSCDHECHTSDKPAPYYVHIRIEDGRLREAVMSAVADAVYDLTGGDATVTGTRHACNGVIE